MNLFHTSTWTIYYLLFIQQSWKNDLLRPKPFANKSFKLKISPILRFQELGMMKKGITFNCFLFHFKKARDFVTCKIDLKTRFFLEPIIRMQGEKSVKKFGLVFNIFDTQKLWNWENWQIWMFKQIDSAPRAHFFNLLIYWAINSWGYYVK